MCEAIKGFVVDSYLDALVGASACCRGYVLLCQLMHQLVARCSHAGSVWEQIWLQGVDLPVELANKLHRQPFIYQATSRCNANVAMPNCK